MKERTYNEMMDEMFGKTYECVVGEEEIYTLRPVIEDFFVESTPDDYSGVSVSVSHSGGIDQELVEMMFGFDQGGQNEDYEIKSTGRYQLSLNVGQISGILGNFGSVSLVTPINLVQIYNLLEEVLSFIEFAPISHRNFKKPPQEDIDELTKFRDMISDTANSMIQAGKGPGGMSGLFRLLRTRSYKAPLKTEVEVDTLVMDGVSKSNSIQGVSATKLSSYKRAGGAYVFK